MTIADNELAAIDAQLPRDLSQEEIDALIAEWIEDGPNRRGASDARITGYGVPVWALIGYAPTARSDLDEIANDYEIPKKAMLAAVFYYLRHRSVIDAWLLLNNQAL